MDQKIVLERLVPYKLQAISALSIALKYWCAWDSPKSLEIYMDGKLAIEGNTNAWINPVLEAGAIHARGLLEFIGLRVTKDGKLANIRGRMPDDVGIEQFQTNDGASLSLVSPADAIGRYKGPAVDAERALVAVFHLSNKALAHLTYGVVSEERWSTSDLELACSGIPALIESYLYTPLGLPMPEYLHASRSRSIEGGLAHVEEPTE